MSFLEGIEKKAGDLLGDPQQSADAASDHVQSMDPGELAGHLQQSLGSMDQSTLSSLGQQLLQTFNSHPSSPADGDTATQNAGTDSASVAAGSPDAVAAMIDYAKNNSSVLQGAASSFLQGNPDAIKQLAPGLLGGILDRLKAQ